LRGPHGDDIYEGEATNAKLINYKVFIEGYYTDESNGNEFFRILNSHGDKWEVGGYGKVAIDRKLHQGVGNLSWGQLYHRNSKATLSEVSTRHNLSLQTEHTRTSPFQHITY